MTGYRIKHGFMNVVLSIDDGIVLKMTVKDLREIISDVLEGVEEAAE